ncbi:MAG: ABC transporter ATP-binding protein [Paludibacter sp.]
MKKFIDIKNLEFRYGNQSKLLSDLNLEIETGRIHGLLGKNGEGKSTLLKLISGLLFPINGEIKVLDFVPGKRYPKMLQGIFFLPEEAPGSNLSIKKFVKTYAPFYPKFRLSKFYDYINDFGIDPLTANINTMSYGQKKKFMIAFGLGTNTKVILMDEPTNGLDIPSKGIFRKIVKSVINENCTVIISSHQVLDLENLIDKIMIMEDHQIVFNETTEDILKKLYFTVGDSTKTDETVIYTEDTLRGLSQVCENTLGKESNLDVEVLFNAVITQPENIKKVFGKTNE